MDDSIPNNPEDPNSANPTALSLFGPGGAGNDFPVLKAFQQYIDAEQAKARKRMLGLSAFFVVLLLVVVVTFTLIMVAVINRNQALSDRLLDIALRDKNAQQPVVNVQQPQPIVQPAAQEASVMKPVLEKLENLATALMTAKQQSAAPAPVVVTTAAPMNPTYPQAESPEMIQLKEELKKQQEALKDEIEKMKKDRAKADAEEQKKAAIEQHRRRLYPEYYAREDAKKAAALAREKGIVAPSPVVPPPPPVPATPVVTRPAIPPVVPSKPEVEKKGALPPSKPAQPAEKAIGKSGAIDYFSNSSDEDEELKELLQKSKKAPRVKTSPVAPANAKKAQSPSPVPPPSVKPSPAQSGTQTLNVGKTEDDSIPWIVNVPEDKAKAK